LLNLNYPDPGHDFYLVVEIKEAAPVFRKYKWNFRELKNTKHTEMQRSRLLQV